ncbi:MAG: hypothetical protein ACI8WM_003523 [Burkholderiaceae bacterium]|jgi:hypothetical protein
MVDSRSNPTLHDQEELRIFAGWGTNRGSVSVCNNSLTGQAPGKCRTILFLHWRIWTAILNNLAMTVDSSAGVSVRARGHKIVPTLRKTEIAQT